MSKRQPYLHGDFQILNDSEEEHDRLGRVFESLKPLASTNKFMTEGEKEFFCQSLKYSPRNLGNIYDYSCCENYIFKELFTTYWRDLTGAGYYEKLYGSEIKEVPLAERRADLDKLILIAKEWEEVVLKKNHSEKLLNAMSIEAREAIKILNSLPEFDPQNNPYIRGSFYYRYKKWNLILFAKFIYIMAKEVFEYSTKDDFLFNLCGETIEMDELSLIHILQRHFGEGVKKIDTGKSHFYGEFKPRQLNEKFKDILQRIDQSGAITPNNIFKIPFLHKGFPYMIWISEKHKQKKGHKGNIKFLHLSSFHPITDEKVLIDLASNFELKSIDDELSIYRPII